jgi:hypothetical protein
MGVARIARNEDARGLIFAALGGHIIEARAQTLADL